MNSHSEPGDSPDQIWENIHESLSRTSIMNHIHKSLSWTPFAIQLHESESWNTFTIHIHESHSQINFTKMTITLQSQFSDFTSQWITINKFQNTINRAYLFNDVKHKLQIFTDPSSPFFHRPSSISHIQFLPAHIFTFICTFQMFHFPHRFHFPLSLAHSNLNTMNIGHTKLTQRTPQIHTQTKTDKLTQTDKTDKTDKMKWFEHDIPKRSPMDTYHSSPPHVCLEPKNSEPRIDWD